MIQCAVCDDESFMLDDVSARLSRFMHDKNIACQICRFSSGRALLERGGPFDILFLDIQMDPPDGMETARLLRKQGYRGLIIFITVLKESVFDSFDVQAFDFLLKPIDDERFRHTMERALKFLEQESGKSILVQRGSDCQVVLFSQIMYCEVLGRKIYLHRQGGETIDYYEKLEHLEQLMDDRFFKCHRSYLVNLEYVRGYNAGLVSLSEGTTIPVSRLREQALTGALLAYMKERRAPNGLV